MNKHLLLVLIALLSGLSQIKAQDSVIFYPDLNNETSDSPGFTFQDVNKPVALEGSNFWWDTKYEGPAESLLGYDRVGTQTAHRIRGYDKEEYYVSEGWLIIDDVDLTNFDKAQVTFFTCTMYALGLEDSPWLSELDIMVSNDYTSDVTSATWTDVTNDLDTIDTRIEYDDFGWVKSTLDLKDYTRKSSVTLAFKYHIDTDGTVDKDSEPGERPGAWMIAEVRFTGTYNPVSVTDNTSNKIFIAPNPASNYVRFSSTPQCVSIYNVTGKQMRIDYTMGSSLNISSLPVGLYFVNMKNKAGAIYTARLIKQ